MQKLLFAVFRLVRYIVRRIRFYYSSVYVHSIFYLFNVKYGKTIEAHGLPIIDITSGCLTLIGDFFSMNSGRHTNIIGRQQPCYIIQNYNSKLRIGNNVGMSSTGIICHQEITIGDNVMLGGNTVIYDTDFHSLNAQHRCQDSEDLSLINRKPVHIGNNVFIGAHSTIMKGTIIGDNSIIAACSLVVGTVPPNQIWGGVPAKFIKSV